MKRFAFCIMALVFATRAVAQTEPANYITALNKFKHYYNNEQLDSIYNTMVSPEMKAQVSADNFRTSTAQLKAQLGNIDKTVFLSYNGSLAEYKATFDNATFIFRFVVNDKSQLNGFGLAPDTVAMDASLTESPVTMKIPSGSISGTLTVPKTLSGKIPVVLIIAGSGPTNRNGNGLIATTDNLRLLAYALGKNGIASLRYDKRMVGQSVSKNKESELTIDDYVEDASGLINLLNDDQRFSKIIVAGHSEGSLVGMLATKDEPVKGFISLAGAGQPADKILTEQMKSQPQYVADGMKRILDSLRKGKITPNVDPALYSIARPSVQPYLMSWCRYDPARELKNLKMPVLIIQGTTDLQVSVDNAQKLKNAKSNAKLVIIRGMNHVLRDAPADKEQNAATYKDPELPLNTEMVTSMVDFIKGL